jgi:hypothetical protein
MQLKVFMQKNLKTDKDALSSQEQERPAERKLQGNSYLARQQRLTG